MAILPINAKLRLYPAGGSSGAWVVNAMLRDVSGRFSNADIEIGNIVFTSDELTGHVVAWRVIQVNGGNPVPPLGQIPLTLDYFDPRPVPSPEPPLGPQLDPTAFICGLTPNRELFLVDSWQLNDQEQRKAAEIENLCKLYVIDLFIDGDGGGGTPTDQDETYHHVQSTPNYTWIVNHMKGLNLADVAVYVGDRQVMVDVEEINSSTAHIRFALPRKGEAFLTFQRPVG